MENPDRQEPIEEEPIGMPRRVLCSRIRPAKNQPRKYFDEQELAELSNGIKTAGQQLPILAKEIYDDPDHDYEIVDGERRWRSAQQAKKETVVIWVVKPKDAKEQFLMSVIANFGRVGHTPMETALMIKELKDMGYSMLEISHFCTHSITWAYQYDSLSRLHPEIKQLLEPSTPEDKRIGFSVALLLTTLPLELQLKIGKTISKKGMKISQARRFIRIRAREAGYVAGDPKRTPNKDYRILLDFLYRLAGDSEQMLDMPSSDFEAMFRHRSPEDRAHMLGILKQCTSNLSQLEEVLTRLQKKDGGEKKPHLQLVRA